MESRACHRARHSRGGPAQVEEGAPLPSQTSSNHTMEAMTRRTQFRSHKMAVGKTMVFPNLIDRRSRKRGVEYGVSGTVCVHQAQLFTAILGAQTPVTLGSVDWKIDIMVN